MTREYIRRPDDTPNRGIPGRHRAKARPQPPDVSAALNYNPPPHIRNTLTINESEIHSPTDDDPQQLAQVAETLGAGATFGPVGLTIVAAAGITIIIYLNREKIGEVANVIGRGIAGTMDAIGDVLNQAGGEAVRQLDRIEEFLRGGIFRTETESSESETSNGGHDVEDVVDSSRRPSREGSTDTRGQQAIKKKVDRGDPAYDGLDVSQETAEEVIREVMNSDNQEVRRSVRRGQNRTDIYDLNTGRGVRISNGEFDTFINNNYSGGG